MKIRRYGVYWANLDPVIGSEISKTRPVIVISDNGMNSTLKTVVVCPLTTSIHPSWRCRIQVALKNKDSEIAVDQIRSISKQRLSSYIDSVDSNVASSIRLLISDMYGE